MVMKGKKRLLPTIFPRKNRRGQFYLVAAIVIITILIGFSVVSNYSRNREVVQLYDLKQELNIETARVLEYGTYQEEEADDLLADFAESYADYAGEGKNMYFFFGNFQKVTAVAYQDLSNDLIDIAIRKGSGRTGNDNLQCKINNVLASICEGSLGGGEQMIRGETKVFEEFKHHGEIQEDHINLMIEILDAKYHFNLRTGENFYFVLEQRVGDERYVVSG
jgi:hypothetical protein